MLWGGRWEGALCLGTHVRIKDFKIKKIKRNKKKINKYSKKKKKRIFPNYGFLQVYVQEWD